MTQRAADATEEYPRYRAEGSAPMRTSRLLSIMSASMLTLVLLACDPARAPYRAATDTSRSTAQQAPTRVTQSQGVALPHGWTLVT